jgi:hypothetical protein
VHSPGAARPPRPRRPAASPAPRAATPARSTWSAGPRRTPTTRSRCGCRTASSGSTSTSTSRAGSRSTAPRPSPPTSRCGARCRRPGRAPPARRTARAGSTSTGCRRSRYATRLATATTGDVEIIQRHHRYAVVWPSDHKDAGTYTWYDPSGAASDHPPKPDELPLLPDAWVAGLAEGAAKASVASADRASGQALLDQLRNDWRTPCAEVTSARHQAVDLMQRADAGSRHDTMTERTHHLVQLAAWRPHRRRGRAMQAAETWATLTVGEDRPRSSSVRCSPRRARPSPSSGPSRSPTTPACTQTASTPPAPVPRLRPTPAAATRSCRSSSRRGGSRPRADRHRCLRPQRRHGPDLAEAVLERSYPALRFAYDAKGWLLRTPERWELHDRLSPWAVARWPP